MREIELKVGKTYLTSCGWKVRIVYEGAISPLGYNYVGLVFNSMGYESPQTYTKQGVLVKNINSSLDIVKESTPYDDFKIDDKVLVWNNEDGSRRYRRYFAGVTEWGLPKTYAGGNTSWSASSADAISVWRNCIKAEEGGQ